MSWMHARTDASDDGRLDALLRRQLSTESAATVGERMAAEDDARRELLAERSRAAQGRRAEAMESAREPPALLRPSRAEREALPLASLPFAWLQITNPLPRRAALPYLDGIALLLELALLGFVDVPLTTGRTGRIRSGSRLVVKPGAAGNPAIDGALGRLRAFGTPLSAQTGAVRIAPYVAALAPVPVAVDETRTRLREAIVGTGAADVRTALLVWMLKQDCALGGATVAAVFPKATGVTPRTLRRVGPDFYSLTDEVTAGVAHRVLFALFTVPTVPAAG